MNVAAAAGNPVLKHVAIAAPTLLVTGLASLPVSALLLDQVSENLIWPAQLGAMAAVGAGVGALLPGIAGGAASHGKGALVGAAAGIGAALLGDAVFFLLLNGIGGGGA